MRIFRNVNVNFMDARKLAFIISGTLIAISLVSLVLHGGPKFGIDFRGGSFLEIKFEDKNNPEKILNISIDDIRSVFAEKGLGDSEIKHYGSTQDISVQLDVEMIKSDRDSRAARFVEFAQHPFFVDTATKPSFDIGWIKFDLEGLGGVLPKMPNQFFGRKRYTPIELMEHPFEILEGDKSYDLLLGGFGYSSEHDKAVLRVGAASRLTPLTSGVIQNAFVVHHDEAVPCFGDSGGPLLIFFDGRWQLLGVTHGPHKGITEEMRGIYNTDPSFCGIPEHKNTLYTSVYGYLDWIQSSSGVVLIENIDLAEIDHFLDEHTPLEEWCERITPLHDAYPLMAGIAGHYIHDTGAISNMAPTVAMASFTTYTCCSAVPPMERTISNSSRPSSAMSAMPPKGRYGLRSGTWLSRK